MLTMLTACYHSKGEKSLCIKCETQQTSYSPNGYPVVYFGDLMLFPTAEQLSTLRDAIDQWLALNPLTEAECVA